MKEMRVSVRGSAMPRTGASRLSWRYETSSAETTSAPAGTVQPRSVHCPRKYMRHVRAPFAPTANFSATFARNASSLNPFKSATSRL